MSSVSLSFQVSQCPRGTSPTPNLMRSTARAGGGDPGAPRWPLAQQWNTLVREGAYHPAEGCSSSFITAVASIPPIIGTAVAGVNPLIAGRRDEANRDCRYRGGLTGCLWRVHDEHHLYGDSLPPLGSEVLLSCTGAGAGSPGHLCRLERSNAPRWALGLRRAGSGRLGRREALDTVALDTVAGDSSCIHPRPNEIRRLLFPGGVREKPFTTPPGVSFYPCRGDEGSIIESPRRRLAIWLFCARVLRAPSDVRGEAP